MEDIKKKNIEVGQRIRNARQLREMSQTELAKKVGYADKTMISHIENGKIDLYLNKLEEIANALSVSPAYLMGWEDENGNDILPVDYVVERPEMKLLIETAYKSSSQSVKLATEMLKQMNPDSLREENG